MQRLLTLLLLVALVAATLFFAARVNSLDDSLQSSRATVRHLEVARKDATRTVGLVRDTLTKTQHELERIKKAKKDAQFDLRQSQPCRSQSTFGHLWLTPSSGPVGTRVHFVGDCFQLSARYATHGYGIFLIRDFADGCEAIVDASPSHLEVHNMPASGYFTVGSQGGCFQNDPEPRRLVSPGRYNLSMGCHACPMDAEFRVTR